MAEEVDRYSDVLRRNQDCIPAGILSKYTAAELSAHPIMDGLTEEKVQRVIRMPEINELARYVAGVIRCGYSRYVVVYLLEHGLNILANKISSQEQLQQFARYLVDEYKKIEAETLDLLYRGVGDPDLLVQALVDHNLLIWPVYKELDAGKVD